MSIGFEVLPSIGMTSLSARRVSSLGVGQLEPRALARVGAEDPEAACVRDHATRRPVGIGWLAEQRRDVDELLERLRSDARRPGGRARRRRVGARERAVCELAAREPAARRAALHRQHRLARAPPGGDARERCADCRTTRGRGARAPSASSSSQHSSRSLEETSALLPIDTNAESPS